METISNRVLAGIDQQSRTTPFGFMPLFLPEVTPGYGFQTYWAIHLSMPCSERELEVLRLLPTGLTGPQIAEKLYLSNNTVKTRMKNIYSKLNVNSRAEAIAQAQASGLIP